MNMLKLRLQFLLQPFKLNFHFSEPIFVARGIKGDAHESAIQPLRRHVLHGAYGLPVSLIGEVRPEDHQEAQEVSKELEGIGMRNEGVPVADDGVDVRNIVQEQANGHGDQSREHPEGPAGAHQAEEDEDAAIALPQKLLPFTSRPQGL